MTTAEYEVELEAARAFAVKLAERILAAHEILARLAEKRQPKEKRMAGTIQDAGLISAWPAVDFETRMRDCLFMLSVHNAVTEAENKTIKKRIAKIVAKRSKRMACNRCDIKDSCEFAFDLYNMDTEPKIDCLASK